MGTYINFLRFSLLSDLVISRKMSIWPETSEKLHF